MSDKHTPGPWIVCEGNGGSIFGDQDNPAHNGDHPYVGEVAGIGVNKDIPECKANAKLIAASPDMFNELKDNHEFLLRVYNSINTYGNAVNLDQIQTEMRGRMVKQLSIIDKATT